MINRAPLVLAMLAALCPVLNVVLVVRWLWIGAYPAAAINACGAVVCAVILSRGMWRGRGRR